MLLLPIPPYSPVYTGTNPDLDPDQDPRPMVAASDNKINMVRSS